METQNRTKVVSCRVTEKLADLIKKYCNLDMHNNPADFMRDALREKIKRDAPELHRQLFRDLEYKGEGQASIIVEEKKNA
jgi:Arc/MetJ-type ribon-helix-helix transcriptional regulator